MERQTPLALFAASDDHALEVVETCEAAGLPVAESVSIIVHATHPSGLTI